MTIRSTNGGWIEKSTGYRRISINGVRFYVHRLMAELYFGRALKPNEEIHHINGDKLDNRTENFELVDISEHLSKHKLKYKKMGKIKQCSRCEKWLMLRAFYKRKTLLGYWSHCKECQSKIRKKYYKKKGK